MIVHRSRHFSRERHKHFHPILLWEVEPDHDTIMAAARSQGSSFHRVTTVSEWTWVGVLDWIQNTWTRPIVEPLFDEKLYIGINSKFDADLVKLFNWTETTIDRLINDNTINNGAIAYPSCKRVQDILVDNTFARTRDCSNNWQPNQLPRQPTQLVHPKATIILLAVLRANTLP
jgi:hypothetical protein